MTRPIYLILTLLLCGSPACIVVQESSDDADNAAGAPSNTTVTTGGSSGQTGANDNTPNDAQGGANNEEEHLPSTVTIELLGALIGPGKEDGTQWDFTDTVPSEVFESLETACGYPGMAAILDVVASAAYQALEKPDPYGNAELDPDGRGFGSTITLANTSTNVEDTFTPLWPQPYPNWENVEFNPNMKLRVNLFDEDLINDDAIGSASISYEDLLAAWRSGNTYWVRVESQTNDQLLAVQIQVSGVAE